MTTTSSTTTYIDATPYQWPYNGNLRPDNTCIIVIDMQIDFCASFSHKPETIALLSHAQTAT